MLLNKDIFTSNREAHIMRVMVGLGICGISLGVFILLSLIIEFPIAILIILTSIVFFYGVGCIAAYFERRNDAKNRE